MEVAFVIGLDREDLITFSCPVCLEDTWKFLCRRYMRIANALSLGEFINAQNS